MLLPPHLGRAEGWLEAPSRTPRLRDWALEDFACIMALTISSNPAVEAVLARGHELEILVLSFDEDIVREAFVKKYEQFRRDFLEETMDGDELMSPRAYANRWLKAVKNCCIDIWRKRRRGDGDAGPEGGGDGGGPPDFMIFLRELAEQVDDEKHRTVLLTWIEHAGVISDSELAELVGVARSTVASWLRRFRIRVQEEMAAK